jgi:hypothetical protein
MEAEMAKNHARRIEAKRSEKEDRRQEQRLAQRLGKVEHAIKEMRAKTPIDPAQAMNMAVARRAMAGERPDFIRTTRGNANFETPVRDHLARLKGRSVSDVADDGTRGARSPLEERRRRK